MAWIFDASRTYVINSKYIISACYELTPVFTINIHVITQKNRGGWYQYTIYKKTDREVKMIEDRIDEIHKQCEDFLQSRPTSLEDYQKRQKQIDELLRELKECHTHAREQRKKFNPNLKETFKKFLSYLSDPDFHKSNNLYDFSEIL